MLKFICYPKCGTCQKAKKWLEEKGAGFDLRDIKENPPTYEELKKWYHEGGYELKKFFNTSGLLYKSLELKNKQTNYWYFFLAIPFIVIYLLCWYLPGIIKAKKNKSNQVNQA